MQTHCRSTALAVILAIVCIVYKSQVTKLIHKKRFNLLFLSFPLIVAFIVIYIGDSSYFSELDQWSNDNWTEGNIQKGIFNGRNEIWANSLELLADSYYIGIGEFTINFHNSAIAALTVFGVLGYIFWYKFFNTIITQIKRYIDMPIVYGCFIAFAIIYLQQTTDLGFISASPNYIPYLALGMSFGRIKENEIKRINEQRLRATVKS
jgi:O-antigen ligase